MLVFPKKQIWDARPDMQTNQSFMLGDASKSKTLQLFSIQHSAVKHNSVAQHCLEQKCTAQHSTASVCSICHGWSQANQPYFHGWSTPPPSSKNNNEGFPNFLEGFYVFLPKSGIRTLIDRFLGPWASFSYDKCPTRPPGTPGGSPEPLGAFCKNDKNLIFSRLRFRFFGGAMNRELN